MRDEGGAVAVLGLGLLGLAGLAAVLVAATRKAEEVPEEIPAVVPPPE